MGRQRSHACRPLHPCLEPGSLQADLKALAAPWPRLPEVAELRRLHDMLEPGMLKVFTMATLPD